MIQAPPPPPAAAVQAASAFAVGQKWACDSAHPDRRLTITVGWIDEMRGFRVVGVTLANEAHDTRPDLLPHAPFDEQALLRACRRRLSTQAAADPHFMDGYMTWRGAFEAGKGGYFNISPDQVLDISITTLQRGGDTR